MKTAYVKTKGNVEIRNLPVPEPGHGEIVIRIDACGICGSDFIEAFFWAKKWKRFGHEVSASVHALGEGVSGLAVGDKVVMALSVPCSECEACQQGMPRYCTQMVIAEQGGFSEYLLVKNIKLLKTMSPSVPAHISCLTEPLTVIIDAFKLADLRANDTLFVAGSGFLGALAVITAHVSGVPVGGILGRNNNDNISSVLELTGGKFVKWPSLTNTFLGPSTSVKQSFSNAKGRIVILHTAPPFTIASYLNALPYGATVVNIGLSGQKKENQLALDMAKNIFRKTQLLSAFPVPCLYLKDAIDLLEQHTNTFSLLKTQSIALTDLPKIITARAKTGKMIVSMER